MYYSVELSRFYPLKLRNLKLMGYHIAIKKYIGFCFSLLIFKEIIGYILSLPSKLKTHMVNT